MIYSLVLPRNNADMDIPGWSHGFKYEAKDEEPLPSTAIFLTSRQIYEESLPMLYNNPWHTMSVSPEGTFFNNKALQTFLQDPYGCPKIPSFVPLIRNWQMDISISSFWRVIYFTDDAERTNVVCKKKGWCDIIAGMKYSAKVMSMSADLKNLRVRVPGQCRTQFDCLQKTLKCWTEVLRPVLKLRPRVKCTFVTSCPDRHMCYRHKCLRTKIVDALQEYKDAVDRGEIIIEEDLHEEAIEVHALYADEDHEPDVEPSAFLEKQVSPPAAARFIQNWQIQIWAFDYFYPNEPDYTKAKDMPMLGDYWQNVTDGIEICGKKLSAAEILRSIRFVLPGHCHAQFTSWETTVEFWIRVLKPLERFRARKRCEVVMHCSGEYKNGSFKSNGQCDDDKCVLVGLALERYREKVDDATSPMAVGEDDVTGICREAEEIRRKEILSKLEEAGIAEEEFREWDLCQCLYEWRELTGWAQ
ncbi:MAG: hypothetical protein Q9179_003036 [Wetmoreana sp. 5 TL-2023]